MRPAIRTLALAFGAGLCLPAFAADYHMTLSGAGSQNGQGWANAYAASQMNSVLNTTMSPGDTLYIAGASGEFNVNKITLSTSGTAGNPKRIVGVDTGNGLPVLRRTWVETAPESGSDRIFELGSGVSHWEISDLGLRNVLVAVYAGNSTTARTGLVFRNLDIQYVLHGFYLSACDDMLIEDCSVVRYAKHAYRLQAGCDNVTFRNCLADLSAGDEDWWDYAVTYPFGFIVNEGGASNNNVTFENCSAYNNRQNLNQPYPNYYNGDGFVVEDNAGSDPNTGFTFIGCVAVNNEDAGFDIKAPATFTDCVAVKNYGGFRLWDTEKTLTNCVSTYPFRRNASVPEGVPSTTGSGVWIQNGHAVLNNVTVHNGTGGGYGISETGSGSITCHDSIISFEGSAGSFTGGTNVSFSTANGNVAYRPGYGVDPDYVNASIDWDGLGDDMDNQTYGTGKGYSSANTAPPSGGVVLSVAPLSDTYADLTAPTTNYGTSNVLMVKDNSSGYDRSAYLRFVIPNGGSVSSATLKLKVVTIGSEGSGSRTVQIRRLASDSWSETGLTWNNRPAAGDIIDTIDAGTVGQTYSIDVSSYVSQEANGDGVVSFVLEQPANVNRMVHFGSRENAGNEPVLEIVRDVAALTPVADVHAELNDPDANHGTMAELAVKDNNSGIDRSAYLRFNLPASGTFTTATLNLKVLSIGGEGAGQRTIQIRRLASDSWTETGLTWNNRPASGTVIATIDAGTPGQTYSIDVSAYVSQEASGDGMASFVLEQPTNVNRLVKFGSRESAGNEPLLLLE